MFPGFVAIFDLVAVPQPNCWEKVFLFRETQSLLKTHPRTVKATPKWYICFSALDCSVSSGSPQSAASILYESPTAMKKATPPRLTPRGSPHHKATGTPPVSTPIPPVSTTTRTSTTSFPVSTAICLVRIATLVQVQPPFVSTTNSTVSTTAPAVNTKNSPVSTANDVLIQPPLL